ncbi:MAG TPA: carboxypeptidase-like regulatory domain-containing protein [Geobacteraceae bacterium]|nr:carboxypeptidase-like regulatory domain-containing protein [Geobacteraceae bacterium]
MPTWETVRRQVAIGGTVTDALTGRPLAGAGLSITAPNVSLDLTTAADGHFHVLDLSDGSYTVQAGLPDAGSRYGKAQAQAVVIRDGSGKIKMAAVDLSLSPTTVSGKVTIKGGTPLSMAEISLRGSGERVYSDNDGNYCLYGVEAGTRLVQVFAQGYKPASQTVNLVAAGNSATADFALEAS